MAATANLTFDNVVATRPTLAELGGATKEDHPKYPPNPATMATANEYNHFTKLLQGLANVTPSVSIWIQFTSGTPAVSAIRAVGSTVVSGDFTVTDNGAGDTTISWAAGKLPNPTGQGAAVSLTADVEIDRVRAYYPTTTSVRVKTKLSATGTDADFLVQII
jgi:hypothetical protein